MSVGDALAAIGYHGAQRAGDVPGGMFAAYFEAHIEQGPVLEAAGLPIGVVSGALGQQWYDVTVTGQDAHAGPTPLALRHDALLATARMIEAVNRIARDAAPHGRGTVGYVEVKPNSRNVIPGARWTSRRTSATCRRMGWTAWTRRCARPSPALQTRRP